jgi:hypothetical protein
VEPGAEGIVVRIHEASGFPVVRLAPDNRLVAFHPHQLKVLALPIEEESFAMSTNGTDEKAATLRVPASAGDVIRPPDRHRSLAEDFDWEMHDPRQHEVTFRKGGLRLSPSVSRQFSGHVSHVELLYDDKKGAIGVHPTTEEAPMAVPIKRGDKGITIACPTFTARLQLPRGPWHGRQPQAPRHLGRHAQNPGCRQRPVREGSQQVMLCLTMTEPWASLVACGAKRIETRSWGTDHRGPLAIHAANGMTGNALDGAIYTTAALLALPEGRAWRKERLLVKDAFSDTRGRVIAFTALLHCIPAHTVSFPAHGEEPAEETRWVAETIDQEVAAGRQVLVWTTFDEEATVIAEALYGLSGPESMRSVQVLTGAQSDEARLAILDRFRAGEVRCLISKPQLLGYGLNLQFVKAMIFSGFDDSFERAYQAVRRAYRFGQTDPVRVFWPYVPELEGLMFSNIRAKEARFLDEVAAQEEMYRKALGMDVKLSMKEVAA